MKNMTIREGDKNQAWRSEGSPGMPPLDAHILVIHNDNLDAFLEEHSIQLTQKQRDLATREKTDTVAMFGQEGLDFVLLSPPDSKECEQVWKAENPTLPEATLTSLMLMLYF